MMQQISCFWNSAHYRGWYQILKSSNSIKSNLKNSPVTKLVVTFSKETNPEGNFQWRGWDKTDSVYNMNKNIT